jgi:ligand-binding SRPBCC domain-containing protein
MYNLKSEQLINLPIEKVFSFFERPENLSLITPNWLKFEILTPEPLTMKSGAIFDYKIKIFIFPSSWKTLITDYNPPYKFVDVQAKGPYKKWIHTHTFEETKEGTIVRDNVDYDIYGGKLGALINEIYIKHSLRSIFNYRVKAIERHLSPKKLNSKFEQNEPLIQLN